MITPAILTISAAVLLPPPTGDCVFGRMDDPAADQQAVATFAAAVDDYVAMQRRLKRAALPVAMIADPEQAEAAAEEFRLLLRDARPQARQGGFFPPAVADVFRFRIRLALREHAYDLEAMTAAVDAEASTTGWWTPIANQPLPLTGPGAAWPLLTQLPELPSELEYRLVARDLVLLDIDANMVLDILDVALPAMPGLPRRERSEPHEETAPYDDRELIAPRDEEFAGCLEETL